MDWIVCRSEAERPLIDLMEFSIMDALYHGYFNAYASFLHVSSLIELKLTLAMIEALMERNKVKDGLFVYIELTHCIWELDVARWYEKASWAILIVDNSMCRGLLFMDARI